MNRRTTHLFVLFIITLTLLSATPASAQRWISSDLLLPYFEVDLENLDHTTSFSVVNTLDEEVPLEIRVHSNWGIEVLEVPVILGGQGLVQIDLADWLGHGHILGQEISEEELATLQKSLLGWETDPDGKYFATQIDEATVTGYVTVRVDGAWRPSCLFGDFFLVDSNVISSEGEQLVDISPAAGCSETCTRHTMRFLNHELDDETQFIVWSETKVEAATDPYAAEAQAIEADIKIFAEDGRLLDHQIRGFLPLQLVDFDEFEISEDFGWIEINTDVETFIAARFHSKDQFSVALQTSCSWDVPGRGSEDAPRLKIQKYTNGIPADLGPGPQIELGEMVEWTYKVTNYTDQWIHDINVTDDDNRLSLDCPSDDLAPGETMICTSRYVAEPIDGQCLYRNIGAVFGTDDNGTEYMDEDTSHYQGYEKADLGVDMKLNGDDYLGAPGFDVVEGEMITWTFDVTNRGEADLGNIEVTDTLGNTIECPKTTLEVGETMKCSALGPAPGSLRRNVVEARGLSTLCKNVASAEDFSYVNGQPENASIDVEKATNGFDADEPRGPEIAVGKDVVWTYVIRNTGNVKLGQIRLKDDKVDSVVCPKSSLDVNESMTCKAFGKAELGQYRNNAQVRAETPAGKTVEDEDPSHYFGVSAAIDLEKATNGVDADTPSGPAITVGSEVVWTYVIHNVGNVELFNVALTDDKVGSVGCPKSTLGVDESMTCTAIGTAILGQYRNDATVSAEAETGEVVEDMDPSHYFGTRAAIDLEKATNGFDADQAPGPKVFEGSAVVWTYVVTNTGNTALSDIQLKDDKIGAIQCPRSRLAAKDSMTCETRGVASIGQYENIGMVSAVTDDGKMVSDSDPSHYFGALADIDLEKATNGDDADQAPGPEILVGEVVKWTYVITNTGTEDLSAIELSDDKIGDISCPNSALKAGESMTCTISGVATRGQYRNEAWVSGFTRDGVRATDSDPSHYFGAELGIDIEKTTNGEDADLPTGPMIPVGDSVEWTYFVKNTGSVKLVDVAVEDDKIGTIECPKDALEPGELMTCTETGVAVAGQYRNEAVVVGWSEAGLEASDSDLSHYYGEEEGDDQGCTHGFWKNHEEEWAAAGYDPNQSLDSVFASAAVFPEIGSATMMEGMNFKGGGDLEAAVRILMIQAVAAVLDAAHPDVNYPRSEQQVIDETNDAIDTMDRDTILAVKDAFDADNNIGCPL